VRLFGTDGQGRAFNLMLQTMDIALVGARVRGVKRLEVGTVVQVEHGHSRARYRVVWISHRDSQVGLESLEPAKCIWGNALPQPVATPQRVASTAATLAG